MLSFGHVGTENYLQILCVWIPITFHKLKNALSWTCGQCIQCLGTPCLQDLQYYTAYWYVLRCKGLYRYKLYNFINISTTTPDTLNKCGPGQLLLKMVHMPVTYYGCERSFGQILRKHPILRNSCVFPFLHLWLWLKHKYLQIEVEFITIRACWWLLIPVSRILTSSVKHSMLLILRITVMASHCINRILTTYCFFPVVIYFAIFQGESWTDNYNYKNVDVNMIALRFSYASTL